MRDLIATAAALPLLPARMAWMRVMRAFERASDGAAGNAAEAVASDEWLDWALGANPREPEPAGAGRR